jgi:hypothetical protein
VTDEEKLEKVARELCRAGGGDPDAKIRLGQPLSLSLGECKVIKPLIVPAWKAYCREARRLSMSDAEHAENSEATHKIPRKRGAALTQICRSCRMLRVVVQRRVRRLRRVATLKTFEFVLPK